MSAPLGWSRRHDRGLRGWLARWWIRRRIRTTSRRLARRTDRGAVAYDQPMRILGTLLLLTLLTACGGGGDEAAEQAPTEVLDVVSGRPLAEFEGSSTYPYRERLVDVHAELVAEMQAVAPHLNEGDLSDVLNTCDVLSREGRGVAVGGAVERFSGGPGERVTRRQAGKLVALSREYVCP